MFECELRPDTGYLFLRPLEGLGAKDGHGPAFQVQVADHFQRVSTASSNSKNTASEFGGTEIPHDTY